MNPNVSFLMLLGGVMLAYGEFLSPGLVAPGVAGGVVAIWGLAQLAKVGIYYPAGGIFLLGLVLVTAEGWFRARGLAGAVGAVLMIWGASHLLNGDATIGPYFAGATVILFAAVTIWLLRLADQARKNKRLV